MRYPPKPEPHFATVQHAVTQHAAGIPFATLIASIGSLATAGAFIVAFFVLRMQIQSQQEARRERHRDHSRLISAVLGPEETRGRPDPQDGPVQRNTSGRTSIYLINGSGEPAYDPVAGIVAIQGAAPRTMEQWLSRRESQLEERRRAARQNAPDSEIPSLSPIPITTASILPPGKSKIWIDGDGWSRHLSGRSSVEIAFTDRAGNHWVRRSSGELEEISDAPRKYFEKYGLFGPYDLQTPEPA